MKFKNQTAGDDTFKGHIYEKKRLSKTRKGVHKSGLITRMPPGNIQATEVYAKPRRQLDNKRFNE